jgi:hypothetical protein
MLSERLQALAIAGVVIRARAKQGPQYDLTKAGKELFALVSALGNWGQRWLPRHAIEEELDVEPLLIDMQRRVRFEALPEHPLVIRLDIDRGRPRFLLLTRSEASLCTHNPGFPEPLRVTTPLSALVGWWRGDFTFAEARRRGLCVSGSQAMKRRFPEWFQRYLFAETPAVHR